MEELLGMDLSNKPKCRRFDSVSWIFQAIRRKRMFKSCTGASYRPFV